MVLHSLRSLYELVGIGFGTYYSVTAMRGFYEAYQKEQHTQPTRMIEQFGGAEAKPSSPTAPSVPSGSSRWAKTAKTLLLVFLTYNLLSPLVAYLQRRREEQQRQRMLEERARLEDGAIIDDEEDEDNASFVSSCQSEDDERIAAQDGLIAPGGPAGRVFVAVCDYEPEADAEGQYLPIHAGDQFMVENYSEDSWCEAVQLSTKQGGFVPGNLLRPLNVVNKF